MNPFEAFRSYSATRRELPLDRILARRDQVLQRLSQSYQALIEEESKQVIWVVEQGALSRAYSTAVEALKWALWEMERRYKLFARGHRGKDGGKLLVVFFLQAFDLAREIGVAVH